LHAYPPSAGPAASPPGPADHLRWALAAHSPSRMTLVSPPTTVGGKQKTAVTLPAFRPFAAVHCFLMVRPSCVVNVVSNRTLVRSTPAWSGTLTRANT